MKSFLFSSERRLSEEQFIDILVRSTLGERRPIQDLARIQGMLAHSNLLCTAWDGDLLIGVARSLTDFVFCCYLSDLAVDIQYQGKGVGTELIRMTQSRLHADAKVVLLAAPKAREYYPKIGMTCHDSAWIASGAPPIAGRPQSVAK